MHRNSFSRHSTFELSTLKSSILKKGSKFVAAKLIGQNRRFLMTDIIAKVADTIRQYYRLYRLMYRYQSFTRFFQVIIP